MKHLQKTVTHLVTDIVPPRLESFGVDVRRRIVCGEDSPLVVAKNGGRELFANFLEVVKLPLVAFVTCLLYTSPSPRDGLLSRMPSSA